MADVLERSRATNRSIASASHRVPLGLMLLSRQQLTAAQLRTALEAQRAAGLGRIGEWLQRLGFVTEEQVTAMLARQWSCPVLRNASGVMGASRFPKIPLLLLEFFQMMPVELVETTGRLLVAFGEGIDYTALYAIEQMLGYHTEACLVCSSVLQKSLQTLARRPRTSDVIFEGAEDFYECARIIGSYTMRIGAQEVRFARCREHLWVRLMRAKREPITIVLRTSS